MAISFNTFAKSGSTSAYGSILGAMTVFGAAYYNSNNFNNDRAVTRLRVFPTTVAYPDAGPSGVDCTLSGYILDFSFNNLTISNGKIIIPGGSVNANASAAGTLSWWMLTRSSITTGTLSDFSPVCISDSITTTGGSGLVIVNTLTPTLNQSVTATLNISIS